MKKLDFMFVWGYKLSDPNLAAYHCDNSCYFTIITDETISRNRDILVKKLTTDDCSTKIGLHVHVKVDPINSKNTKE